MDKKYTLLGVLLILVASGLMWHDSRHQTQQAALVSQPVALTAPAPSAAVAPTLIKAIDPAPAAPAAPQEPEVCHTLENETLRVTLTSHGGAIKSIHLKHYPLELGSQTPFIFNAETHTPALALALPSSRNTPEALQGQFALVDRTQDTVRLRYTSPEGLEIIRAYHLTLNPQHGQDPYVITHETRVRNLSPHTVALNRLFLSLGSFPETPGDPTGEFLNVGYYSGKSTQFVRVSEFRDSKGFLGMGARQALQHKYVEPSKGIVWASVKNQFFASVFTPSTQPACGLYVAPSVLNTANSTQEALSGYLQFSLPALEANASAVLGGQYYVGPKELRRLENLGGEQDTLMQFGFFGFISKLLLSLMIAIHGVVPNWGLTIILVTVLVKLLLWPLTAAQVRSGKRMQAIQAPLKALKEKFKDNPQKLQSETMRLFKEHGVNPAAGCLPIVFQIPIFFGLYFMLRASSELRFASFLWIPDLSVPDTLMMLGGFPLNALPLVMGVTMYYQMKTMPSPATDPMQRKLFQFMPFMFLFFCYNFPSGLVLYWTVQNVLTIVQQYYMTRQGSAQPAAASGDAVARSSRAGTLKKRNPDTRKKT